MRVLILIPLAIRLSFPISGLAQTDPACWNRDVERLEFYENPPEGGDNAFFTGVVTNSSSSNVTLLYPAKASMMDFAQKLYRIRVDLGNAGGAVPTGGTNTYLNGLAYFMPTNITPPYRAARVQGLYNQTTPY